MQQVFDATKEKMEKCLNSLNHELSSMRAGRASAAVLDRISVDYYGSPTPIAQMAAISVSEGRIITIQPWDGGTLGAIEKAIQASDLGINPQNDGKIIRLTFAAPTEEKRKQLAKDVKNKGEDAKITIRSIRRDSIEALKKLKKNSEITEDDLRDGEDTIQKITDKYIKEVDEMSAAKEKEIMEI
ncbi:MAG: ribosome recycling factor [Oscillospiraceae bacterium]